MMGNTDDDSRLWQNSQLVDLLMRAACANQQRMWFCQALNRGTNRLGYLQSCLDIQVYLV